MLDYNSRLKPMGHKGKCGDPEKREEQRILNDKVNQLAQLMLASKHTVVFTGAGISTSSGIPDFRGPNGVWTRELRGEKLSEEEKRADIFNQATPSFTHNAITSLIQRQLVHHVISQNVDGLHLRSGVADHQLSELHGNICMEICEICNHKYFRSYDVGGMNLQPTGNICEDPICQGILRDFAVDWDTDLPKDIFDQAYKHLRQADLCIVLGSSLRIRPAGNMPLSVLRKSKARGGKSGKIAIVNLQVTHIDQKSAVRIFHDCDTVMKLLCQQLAVFVDYYFHPIDFTSEDQAVITGGDGARNSSGSTTSTSSSQLVVDLTNKNVDSPSDDCASTRRSPRKRKIIDLS